VHIFDTDVSVDIARGYMPALLWFDSLEEVAAISGYAYMEVLGGCKDKGEIRRVRMLLSPLQVVWPNEQTCGRGLTDFAQYHLSHNLGILDALIAATAIDLGATLCTFNTKHFSVVPGLTTEQPYERG
jgi:predicted nucleic acid-binding protein